MQQICFDFAQFTIYLLDKLTTHHRLVPKLSNCETLYQPRRQVPLKVHCCLKSLRRRIRSFLLVKTIERDTP